MSVLIVAREKDFNPRPPRGGRHYPAGQHRDHRRISIHAPHEGGGVSNQSNDGCVYISIHAPHEGGDYITTQCVVCQEVFQSTPPTRGATRRLSRSKSPQHYFNPRPPRGGRHELPVGDLKGEVFQSTPPTRGATAKMHSFTCGSLTNK